LDEVLPELGDESALHGIGLQLVERLDQIVFAGADQVGTRIAARAKRGRSDRQYAAAWRRAAVIGGLPIAAWSARRARWAAATWLPHAAQPGRARRANSSIFGRSGYIRSIIA